MDYVVFYPIIIMFQIPIHRYSCAAQLKADWNGHMQLKAVYTTT